MKRLFQPGNTLIPLTVCLSGAIFCLLFALSALVVAQTPPRHLPASGAGSTAAEGTQVTPIDPFVGTNSETWERFGVGSIPSGTSILGGIATISGCCMRTQHTFALCTFLAEPADGTILMDQDRPQDFITISFSEPVLAFGAYWGSGIHCSFGDAASILTFKDVNGNVIGSDSFFYTNNGPLDWHGYSFAAPVKTITRTASDGQEGFAIDGLQATVASSGGHSLANISTRLRVETGDNAPIAGFIVTGVAAKNIALRGIGPSLAGFGITDALADPTLELRDDNGVLLLQNDDWQDDPAQASQLSALGLAPQDSNESGIVATLQPGASYTAILAGKNNGTGTGLVEVYDINPEANSQLANISTRGFVQTGVNVMIGGFIVGGSGGISVVVRGVGPSLTGSGVNNVLADPSLELRDSNAALLASNDNWQDDSASAAQLSAYGLAPQNSLESGIFAALPSGAFTAILTGKNGGTGVGLVEIYHVQ